MISLLIFPSFRWVKNGNPESVLRFPAVRRNLSVRLHLLSDFFFWPTVSRKRFVILTTAYCVILFLYATFIPVFPRRKCL